VQPSRADRRGGGGRVGRDRQGRLRRGGLDGIARTNIIVDVRLTEANGTAERTTALDMMTTMPTRAAQSGPTRTVTPPSFVAGCRERRCVPHVAQNNTNRLSAIDGCRAFITRCWWRMVIRTRWCPAATRLILPTAFRMPVLYDEVGHRATLTHSVTGWGAQSTSPARRARPICSSGLLGKLPGTIGALYLPQPLFFYRRFLRLNSNDAERVHAAIVRKGAGQITPSPKQRSRCHTL
jgi:hypothetical protein